MCGFRNFSFLLDHAGPENCYNKTFVNDLMIPLDVRMFFSTLIVCMLISFSVVDHSQGLELKNVTVQWLSQGTFRREYVS